MNEIKTLIFKRLVIERFLGLSKPIKTWFNICLLAMTPINAYNNAKTDKNIIKSNIAAIIVPFVMLRGQ